MVKIFSSINTPMKNKYVFWVAVLAILAVCLTGCDGKTETSFSIPLDAQIGDLVLAPCEYEARDITYAAECGTLIVPENRGDPVTRMIALPITRIHSTASDPGEPIYFLPGGPGLPNEGTSRVAWFIENHDIVSVGYRGVDGSVILSCPEISQHIMNLPGDMLGEAAIEQMTNAYAQCADRLQDEGVDLDGYTVVDVVDDLEAARIALGYEKINLYSISYGTRLAMIYAWRYGENLHRSAMVAINPPGRMFYYDPAVIDDQIKYYSVLCAKDPICSSKTNDLAESIRIAVDSMPERWLGVPLNNGLVRAAAFESLGDNQGSAKVFDVWLAAAEGDYSGVALLSVVGPYMFANASVWGDNIAKAANADFDQTSEKRSVLDIGASIMGSPRSELAAAAAGWPINTIPAEYQTVQPSDVETLLISGSIDFWTPAQYVEEELLLSLQQGQHIILGEFGHADMLWQQPEASARLLSSFFVTGVVDDSLFVYQPWVYEVGLGFPTLAKIIVAAILVVITTLILVLRSLINKKVRS
ncbi:MAG TPA: alpha/beta hydrolase [Anaerolineales bacterium]|jgi:pimeloyl-ACP methyl ester carboxylesterase|nr:alpha/beta hydrolase [Anaerolineales bacterium]